MFAVFHCAIANSRSQDWQVGSALEVSGFFACILLDSDRLTDLWRPKSSSPGVHLNLRFSSPPSAEECGNTSLVTNFAQIQVSIVKLRYFRRYKHKKDTFLSRVDLICESQSKIKHKKWMIQPEKHVVFLLTFTLYYFIIIKENLHELYIVIFIMLGSPVSI